MQYYVNSAGHSSSADYRWYKCTNSGLEPNEPFFFDQVRNEKLLDFESISLLFLRNKEDLLCLLIQLPKTQRQDFQGRYIRNSLAWIAHNQEDNLKLQGIASSFLQNIEQFAKEVNDWIKEDSNSINIGFYVDFNRFKEITLKLRLKMELTHKDVSTKVAYNIQERRIELGEQLQEIKIPNRIGILVIVAKYADPKITDQSNSIWRLLSDLEESIEWKIIKNDFLVKPISNKTNCNKTATETYKPNYHPVGQKSEKNQSFPKDKRKEIAKVKTWIGQGTRLSNQKIANKCNLLTLEEVEKIAQQLHSH